MWARFRNNCSACVWWEIWFVISSLNTGLEIIIIFYMQIKWFCTNQVKWMVFWLEFTHDYSLNGNGKSRRTKIDVQIGENDDWCQNSVLLPLMKPIILFCQSNLPKRFILLYDFSSNDICPNEISLRIRRGFFFRSYPVRLFHIPNEKKKKNSNKQMKRISYVRNTHSRWKHFSKCQNWNAGNISSQFASKRFFIFWQTKRQFIRVSICVSCENFRLNQNK